MWLFMAVACFVLQATDSEESSGGTHLNPQEFMTISEIIQYWEYPSEEYQVLTDDGYYLKVDRIPYGVRSSGKTGPRPVVLIVHGILAEGRIWMANVPSNSLSFFLADAGYDVWLLNCRGNSWSRKHQTLSIDQEQFWDFSFHEMGIYDVPAAINFILEKTQQDGLYYIGHSQGASIALIAFSVMPELCQKVKLLMCFAPPYTFEGSRGPVRFAALIPDGLIRSRADVYNGIDPDFNSVKTLVHWRQVIESHEFKNFDYGYKNKAVYNTSTPPFYKVEDMSVPTAVWSGANDRFMEPQCVENLLPHIKYLVFYKRLPYWGHQDFVWGLNAPKFLYPEVLSLMNMYE
ncbi:hypothetical protein lerEdw1_001958 [Lerista edwardsae]|nr:hypothetical protein lerEdw1_001958 [Lerista edwardsae]